MSVLYRKVFREVFRMGWQYAAVALLIALGIAVFAASYMSYRNLELSYRGSYERLKFEDFGIQFREAPERVVERVRRLPGVVAAEGRLTENVAVKIPGKESKQLTGKLISVPVGRELEVNQLKIVAGRPLTSRTAREILLNDGFAKHHNLKPGDTLEVSRGREEVKLRIAGVVRSPEYIYVVQSEQQIFPTPDTFGVMFVSQDVLGPLVSHPSQINEIRVRTSPSANQPLLMHETKAMLDSYGAQDPVPREDQPSHQLLQQDLQGFQAYSVMFPLLFLGASAFTIYSLLMRMVHTQRPTIGLLRAYGYSRRQVVLHYLCLPVMLGVVGSLIGVVAGNWMAAGMTRLYLNFVAVPYLVVEPHVPTLIAGVVIGMAASIVSSWSPARKAASIPPAVALRPLTPEVGRTWAVDRFLPFLRNVQLLWHIPFRNIFRNPRRTLTTILGVSASMSLLITARGIQDSTDVSMEQVFREMFTSDIQVSFIDEVDESTVMKVRSWPGVIWAEGVLQVPVEFRKGDLTYSALVTGLESSSRFSHLRSEDEQPVALTKEGFVMGQVIQQKLQLERGDTVQLSIPRALAEDEPRLRTGRVADFVWEPIGTIAYLPLHETRQLFQEDLELPPKAINSIRVKVAPEYADQTKRWLEDLEYAASAQKMSDVRKEIEQMLALTRQFVLIMLVFGAAIAFGILFTMVTVNILERTNEVATLRTIGVGRLKLAAIIMLENVMTALLGVIVGVPLGRLFLEGLIAAATSSEQMELFSYQVVVFPGTYLVAAGIIMLTVLVAQIPALRYVNQLDLARATKERAM